MLPDVVYPVRTGDRNEELRYSLRSLRNLPHGNVWIVGHRPPWVKGVLHYPREQRQSKYLNATVGLVDFVRNMRHALTRPFVLFNDDFYVTRPVQGVPILNMGRSSDRIAYYQRNHHTGAYWRGMVQTYNLLQRLGYRDPLNFELHVPMPMEWEPLLLAWEMGRHIPILHIRTMYGNLAGLEGHTVDDPKAYTKDKDFPESLFLSSNDFVPPRIRDLFKEPGPYESDS